MIPQDVPFAFVSSHLTMASAPGVGRFTHVVALSYA
jgi:hypothetical protein